MKRYFSIFIFGFWTFSAWSMDPFVSICNACTEQQKQQLATTVTYENSAWPDSPGASAPIDIYILNPADNSVIAKRGRVVLTNKTGTPKYSASVSSITADSYVVNQIHGGVQWLRDLGKNGISWYALDWGNSLPITSAHPVAADSGVRGVLQSVVENHLSNRTASQLTVLGVKTVENLLGLGFMTTVIELEFPDGTKIDIELTGSPNGTGLSVAIKEHTAMDGSFRIPTTSAAATSTVNWPALSGDTLSRFLETARMLGVPIETGGSGNLSSCSWDGKTLKCRRG